jgi:hypothetical protein
MGAVGRQNCESLDAFAALRVPGQTTINPYAGLNPINHTAPRNDRWTVDEDNKLKAALGSSKCKTWEAIADVIPGRTVKQCTNRWYDIVAPSIDLPPSWKDPWTADEDGKLKDAVERYGGKNWDAIAALVPHRSTSGCRVRWHDILASGQTRKECTSASQNGLDTRRMGQRTNWTSDEDNKLRAAFLTHNGKNWAAITEMVPGKTKKQVTNRWYEALGPDTNRSATQKGRWTEDEDIKLKDAVERYGGKNWEAIAALVPRQSTRRCRDRWHNALAPGQTGLQSTSTVEKVLDTGRKGRWTPEEDVALRNAFLAHNGKNWVAVAALVPGRSRKQCWNRWHDALDPSIEREPESTGYWTLEEDNKLKYAVGMLGEMDWDSITFLVTGRVKKQCMNRWYSYLKSKAM